MKGLKRVGKLLEPVKNGWETRVAIGLLTIGSAFSEDNPMISEGLSQINELTKGTASLGGQILSIILAWSPVILPVMMLITTILEKRKKQAMGQEIGFGGALVAGIKDYMLFYIAFALILSGVIISLKLGGYSLTDMFRKGWAISLGKG